MTLDVDIVKVYQVKEDVAKYDTTVSSAQALVEMVYPLYEGIDREMVMVVGMNVRNNPNVINCVSIGSVDHSTVTPREVFKPLVLSNSSSFILVHNHPSDYLIASEADIAITKRLYELGKEMKIEMYDHIILGNPDRYNSFKANGIFFK